MKKILPCLLFAFAAYNPVFSQACTTTNATNCHCKDNSSTNCDLLPNIILAEEPLLVSGNNGVIEYAQTGNGAENGRLRVSVSTPNIGLGPLTVRATSRFICGADTFTTNPGTCSDGSSPRQMIVQRVYHKNGNVMSYYDRDAGSMTYHPSHGHMHVDDWGVYTLRRRDSTIADPMQWPLIGSGAKLGFCLMDYGDCSYYNGHCQDSAGNTLLNGDFPNWGLGGGNYNCSPTEQGISSGYTDIYYQYLDGMYITIPPNTCNGEYYIVVKIDPHDYFLEENENDNVIAIPFMVTKQLAAGTASITTNNLQPCENTPVTLTASPGVTYLWNTTDTTQSISITQAGTYSVQVQSQCGLAASPPITITSIPNHIINTTDLSLCESEPVVLNASGTGSLHWFDALTDGNELYAGNTYSPTVTGTTTFFVETRDSLLGFSGHVGPVDNTIGTGGMFSNDQHQVFSTFKTVVLRSVKVYAGSTKDRIIELRNSAGAVLQSLTVNIAQGMQVVPLNFTIPAGTNYQLGWEVGSSPDLYRNSDGATYPYTIPGLISITGNSVGSPSARWYAFYDWQVEETSIACTSIRTPVTVTVKPSPSVSLSGLANNYLATDSPVALIGNPAGGSFSGPGVVSDTFYPAVAGVGGPYTITYTYTDSNSCAGSGTVDVTVLNYPVSATYPEGISRVKIFPNPNAGEFELMLQAADAGKINLTITDATGRKVYTEENIALQPTMVKNIKLKNAAKGIYNLTLNTGKKQQTYKLVID